VPQPFPAPTLRRALLAWAVCAAAAGFAAPAQADPGATDIAQLRDGVSLGDVDAAGGRVAGRLEIIHGLAVRLPRAARTTLSRDRRVKAISVNARVRPKSESPATVPSSSAPAPPWTPARG
jgi:hypothetical protein